MEGIDMVEKPQLEADKQKQYCLHLAKWWVGRAYTGKIKGGGIGSKELLTYLTFKPSFVIPPDEHFDHAGHFNLVKGKNGYEVYPATINVEQVVNLDPSTRLFLVPVSAIEENHGKYFIVVSNGKAGASRQEITLENSKKSADGRVMVKSGLKSGDKIIIKEKHPHAGELMMAPVPAATSREWDSFGYLVRLIRRAKEEIWSSNEKEEVKISKLTSRIAEIFYQSAIIKNLPKSG